MKTALIIGCEGQDGSYLIELLEERGYLVGGIGRKTVRGALPAGVSVDLQNYRDVTQLIAEMKPDEVYYLAAFHHSSENVPPPDEEWVRVSFEINTLALNNLLAAIASGSPDSRLFYAASSRIYGHPTGALQDEDTPLNPVEPYGISKAAGVHLCRYYRKQKGLYASAGILYNHESPRRSAAFVTRKIALAAASIARGSHQKLKIRSLEAMVDWGYAPDYVDAMWRILQVPEPNDFVISSGAVHSVRDFIEVAFEAVGLDWTAHVEVTSCLTRGCETETLRGNSARLTRETGWQPTKSFRGMVQEMLKAEMENEP